MRFGSGGSRLGLAVMCRCQQKARGFRTATAINVRDADRGAQAEQAAMTKTPPLYGEPKPFHGVTLPKRQSYLLPWREGNGKGVRAADVAGIYSNRLGKG